MFNPSSWVKSSADIPTQSADSKDQVTAANESFQEIDQALIDATIQKELGLTPEQIEVNFRFGNHVIDADRLNEIESGGYNILAGEFSRPLRTLPQDYFIRSQDTAIGIGVTRQEAIFHTEALRKLLHKGVVFGLTDGLPMVRNVDSGVSSNDVKVIGAVAGAALLIGAVAAMVRGKMSRRGFLAASAAGLAAIGLGQLLGQNPTDVAIDLAKKSGDEMGRLSMMNDILALQSVTEGSSDGQSGSVKTKDGYLPYSQGVITLRNKIMALNTWQMLSEYSPHKDGSKDKMMVMAGLMHQGVVEEFVKGREELALEIGKYADVLVSDLTDSIVKEALKVETKVKKGSGIDPYAVAHNGSFALSKLASAFPTLDYERGDGANVSFRNISRENLSTNSILIRAIKANIANLDDSLRSSGNVNFAQSSKNLEALDSVSLMTMEMLLFGRVFDEIRFSQGTVTEEPNRFMGTGSFMMCDYGSMGERISDENRWLISYLRKKSSENVFLNIPLVWVNNGFLIPIDSYENVFDKPGFLDILAQDGRGNVDRRVAVMGETMIDSDNVPGDPDVMSEDLVIIKSPSPDFRRLLFSRGNAKQIIARLSLDQRYKYLVDYPFTFYRLDNVEGLKFPFNQVIFCEGEQVRG